MRILGIESSCDETGLAIYDTNSGLLAHALFSQISTHKPYGGVVPELASRDHVKYLVPLLDEVLYKANLHKSQLDGIAYTAGPGLVGALLTGACFAKSLAFALKIPALAVHHLEAHLLAAQLDNPQLKFPFVVLLVSGGHTQLMYAKSLGNYEILGETIDDAVGEAFDKTAKLMGLPYPGGAILAKLADSCLSYSIKPFPRPLLDKFSLNFSFSGLKTHVLTVWNKSDKTEKIKAEIAAAFQEAVIDVLKIKCERALNQTQSKVLVVAGGVGANLSLRKNLQNLLTNMQGEVYFPRQEYCTDNGAMVAYAGALHFLNGKKDASLSCEIYPRWGI